MLSKSKLLQWVEDKIEVNSGPFDDDHPEDAFACKCKVGLLRVLEMDIRAGRLDAEEVEVK